MSDLPTIHVLQGGPETGIAFQVALDPFEGSQPFIPASHAGELEAKIVSLKGTVEVLTKEIEAGHRAEADFKQALEKAGAKIEALEGKMEALANSHAALTDERDDLKSQRDAMRANVPLDEQLLGHMAMQGIAKSHDAYKAQKWAERDREVAVALLRVAREYGHYFTGKGGLSAWHHFAVVQESNIDAVLMGGK